MKQNKDVRKPGKTSTHFLVLKSKEAKNEPIFQDVISSSDLYLRKRQLGIW